MLHGHRAVERVAIQKTDVRNARSRTRSALPPSTDALPFIRIMFVFIGGTMMFFIGAGRPDRADAAVHAAARFGFGAACSELLIAVALTCTGLRVLRFNQGRSPHIAVELDDAR